jgi:ATP-dependent protease ClpP protease subunit
LRFLALCLSVLVSCTAFAARPKQHAIAVRDFDDANTEIVSRLAKRQLASGAPYLIFNIDSFGGSFFSGMELIKRLEDLKAKAGVKAVCIVDVKSMSMGFLFLQSRVCDIRLMTKRSMLLAHGGSSQVRGTAQEIEQGLAFIRVLNAAAAEIESARLNISMEEFLRRIEGKDWIMGWREALEVGAVDGIIDDADLPLLDN